MRTIVMKTAWELKRKFNYIFKECLKAAWRIYKFFGSTKVKLWKGGQVIRAYSGDKFVEVSDVFSVEQEAEFKVIANLTEDNKDKLNDMLDNLEKFACNRQNRNKYGNLINETLKKVMELNVKSRKELKLINSNTYRWFKMRYENIMNLMEV